MKPPDISTVVDGDRELVVWCFYSGAISEDTIRTESHTKAVKLMANLDIVLPEAWAANNIPVSRADTSHYESILAMIDAQEPVLYLKARDRSTGQDQIHIYLDENMNYEWSEVLPE